MADDPLAISTGRGFWSGEYVYMFRQGTAVGPTTIPGSWGLVQEKAAALSSMWGRDVTSVVEAIWYPRYEGLTQTFHAWLLGRIRQTVAGAGEITWATNWPDNDYGWTSVQDIGRYYDGWLLYAVKTVVEEAVSGGWTEEEMLVRIEAAFQAIQGQVRAEVERRLAAFAPTVQLYTGFYRPYFMVSVPATLIFIVLLAKVRQLLYLNLVYLSNLAHAVRPEQAGVLAKGADIIVELWDKFRVYCDPGRWGGQFVRWLRDTLTGHGQELGFAAPGLPMITPSLWVSFVGAIAAVLFTSFEVEAPEMTREEWDRVWGDPRAKQIENEVHAFVEEAERLHTEIANLSVGGPGVGPSFVAVEEGTPSTFGIAGFASTVGLLEERIRALSVSEGMAALLPVKVGLQRELDVKTGTEAKASLLGAVSLTADELLTFVDPAALWAIIRDRFFFFSSGRSDLSEEEVEAFVGQAVDAERGEIDAYLAEVAVRAGAIKREVLETPLAEVSLSTAVEAMGFLKTLVSDKCVDRLLYEQVQGQLRGCLPGLPDEGKGKVEEYLRVVEEILEVFSDAGSGEAATS